MSAAQSGKDWLLKIGDGMMSEGFTTLGGLRNVAMTINNEAIDITTIDSSQMKTLLDAAGIQSFAVSANGIFDDSTTHTRLRTVTTTQALCSFQLFDGPGNKYAGKFKVTQLEQAGTYNGALDYKISLQSSGAITFTAHS